MYKCHVSMSYLPTIPEAAFLSWSLINAIALMINHDPMVTACVLRQLWQHDIADHSNRFLHSESHKKNVLTHRIPFFPSLIGLLKSRLSSKRAHWLLGFTVLERPLCHMSFVSNWSHKRNKVENKKGNIWCTTHDCHETSPSRRIYFFLVKSKGANKAAYSRP